MGLAPDSMQCSAPRTPGLQKTQNLMRLMLVWRGEAGLGLYNGATGQGQKFVGVCKDGEKLGTLPWHPMPRKGRRICLVLLGQGTK